MFKVEVMTHLDGGCKVGMNKESPPPVPWRTHIDRSYHISSTDSHASRSAVAHQSTGPPSIAALLFQDADHSSLLKLSLRSTSLQAYLLGQLVSSWPNDLFSPLFAG